MKKYFKFFFLRIFKDLRQKELLPLKLLFFLHASTIFVLYPYLTIHMRELGINVEETAIMSAVTPVVSILMPPIAGIVADKLGNFKVMLAIFSALSGTSALLLLLIPVGRITENYPNEVIFGLSCTSNSPIRLSLYEDFPCTPLNQNQVTETNVKLEACGFVCQAITDDRDSQAILSAKKYGVQMHNIKQNSSITVTYELNSKVPVSSEDTGKMFQNNKLYLASIRKLSLNSYFFPTPTLFNFSCGYLRDSISTKNETNNSVACMFGSKDQFKQLDNIPKEQFMTQIGIKVQNQSVNDKDEKRYIYNMYTSKSGINLESSTCVDNFPKNKEFISISVPLHRKNDSELYKNLDLGSCAPRCIATSLRSNVCSNQKTVIELNIKLTFWSYFAVRVFLGMISGTAFAMFEGAVIAILREQKADYGMQRIYATIGGMISSPISGFLIDYASKGKDHADFRPIFYFYAILKISSAALMLFMDLKFKTPANNIMSDVVHVLKKVELISVLIICFLLGTAWGYIESFLFWLLQDLGATKSLMGITITVSGLAGIPLLVLSGPIIKRIGHANVIFIGFMFYAMRLLGYSLIYNPWLCLIFEAMESITTSLTFTAIVTYAAKLSTVTTDSSIQGLIGGLYFGVGKGAGSLIGGFLMKGFGIRETFQIFSVAYTVIGITYFLFNYFFLRKRLPENAHIAKQNSIEPIEGNKSIPKDIVNNQPSRSVLKEEPLSYEDAFTNLGFEDTELENTVDNKL